MVKYIISICICFHSGLFLYSQNYQAVPVEKSTEKVILGGTKYYVHTVKKGQTLYSISKAYGVSENEILQSNGTTSNILKEGQVLKIPIIDVTQLKYDEKEYIKHQIITGETLYSLSKRYNMDVERIVECNPGIDASLSVGQMVFIPKNYINTHSTKPDYDDYNVKYKTIIVKDNETLYSISKLYGVTIDELKAANAGTIDVIKVGQELRIPIKTEELVQVTETNFLPIDDTSVISIDSGQYINLYPPCTFEKYHSQFFVVAILLPFEVHIEQSNLPSNMDTESNISINKDDTPTEQGIEKVLYRKNFMELYEGMLLAIDSLKTRGLKLKLLVYDTKNDINTVKAIVNSKEFQDVNLIIGPVFPDEVKIVNEFSSRHKIPVISPLSTNSVLVSENPFLFQVIPSEENQMDATASYLASKKDSRIIFIHDEDSANILVVEQYKKLLNNKKLEQGNIDSLDFVDVIYSGSRWDDINNVMTKDKPNLVFMPSADEAYINKTISKLYLMSDKYNIQLIGFPDWQYSKSLDLNYLHLMQLQIVAPFFVDYSNLKVQMFLQNYREAYKSEPFSLSSKGFTYGMLGYDISFYFINALFTYGKDFIGCIENYKCNSLETDFIFSKKSLTTGFDNRNFQIIQYTKDYNIHIITTNDN